MRTLGHEASTRGSHKLGSPIFMSGITRWEVAGDVRTGLGARYRMLFRIGAAELGQLLKVVEFDEPCDLAWTSVTGLDHRRPVAAARGCRRPDARRVPRCLGHRRRGPERLAGRADRGTHRDPAREPDLRKLDRLVEQKQPRERAGARRRAAPRQ